MNLGVKAALYRYLFDDVKVELAPCRAGAAPSAAAL